jgi:hypothetical protein
VLSLALQITLILILDDVPGYKMRGKINEGIVNRGKTLKNKYEACKRLGAELGIQLPPLKQIIDATSIGDIPFFDEDLKDKEWAKSPAREWIKVHSLFERAKEELKRIVVEVPRTIIGINRDLFRAAKALQSIYDLEASTDPGEHLRGARLAPLAIDRFRRLSRLQLVVTPTLFQLHNEASDTPFPINLPAGDLGIEQVIRSVTRAMETARIDQETTNKGNSVPTADNRDFSSHPTSQEEMHDDGRGDDEALSEEEVEELSSDNVDVRATGTRGNFDEPRAEYFLGRLDYNSLS